MFLGTLLFFSAREKYFSAQEKYLSAQEKYLSAQEKYLSAQEKYLSAREKNLSAREIVAQPTNPVGRVYGRQPKTVAKRYIIAPKVSTFAL